MEQFSKPMARRPVISSRVSQVLQLAAILLLVALVTFNQLGGSDVCGGSEAIMAVYIQQMVEHHALLFPLDNCSIPMYKPPLFHWTASAFDYVLRQNVVTPFNLRLPSAMYAVAGAVLTMIFAVNLLGMRGAVLAGAILAGSYQYISQGRIGLVDMTLTFFETLSLYAFWCWFALDARGPGVSPSKSRLHYLFAVAMALGVLAKGPVGALLPAGAVIVFLASDRRWRTLRDIFKLGPLLTGAALGSSWYVACLIGRRFEFLSLQLESENFGRFFGSLGSMPAWYYIHPLLLNSGPLSLLVPAAVISALSTGRSPHEDDRRNLQKESAALCARLFAIFWILTVIFFEISAFKRRAYLLPLWPASAVLLSWWVLYRVVPRIGRIAHHALIATCLFLALANFFFIPAYELRGCGKSFSVAEIVKRSIECLPGRSCRDSYQTDSFRQAAAAVDKVVGRDQPLFVFGIDGAIEPLIFYLRRCAPLLSGTLDTARAGYVISGADAWKLEKDRARGFHPVLMISYGTSYLILLQGDLVKTSRADEQSVERALGECDCDFLEASRLDAGWVNQLRVETPVVGLKR